jgi:hypothetical protein
MKRASIALLLLSFVAPCLPRTAAQSQSKLERCGTGIEGRTTGIQGWLIVDATVRIINRKTKETADFKSDANGEYLACLPAGTYDVIANALGYKTARRKSIKVESPGRNVVDIVMTPSGLVSHR